MLFWGVNCTRFHPGRSDAMSQPAPQGQPPKVRLVPFVMGAAALRSARCEANEARQVNPLGHWKGWLGSPCSREQHHKIRCTNVCDELVIGGGLNLRRCKDIKFSGGLIEQNIAISNENIGVDFSPAGAKLHWPARVNMGLWGQLRLFKDSVRVLSTTCNSSSVFSALLWKHLTANWQNRQGC